VLTGKHRRTDGQPDGRPENTMPWPPVMGGGIIINFEKKLSKPRRKLRSFFVYASQTIMPIKSN